MSVEIPLTTEQFDGWLASRVVAAFDAVPTVECPECNGDGQLFNVFDSPDCTGCNRWGRVPFVSGDAVLIEKENRERHIGAIRVLTHRSKPVTIEAIVTRDDVRRRLLYMPITKVRLVSSGRLMVDPNLFDALPSGDYVGLCKWT